MVNAHEGKAGWSKPLYEEHLKEALVATLVLVGMSAEDTAAITKEAEKSARKSSAGECLAELFLILTDRARFGNLCKLFKNNQLTAEKQNARHR